MRVPHFSFPIPSFQCINMHFAQLYHSISISHSFSTLITFHPRNGLAACISISFLHLFLPFRSHIMRLHISNWIILNHTFAWNLTRLQCTILNRIVWNKYTHLVTPLTVSTGKNVSSSCAATTLPFLFVIFPLRFLQFSQLKMTNL